MGVRPLINCIISEIETFLVFYDHGINIYSIDHCLSVFPVFAGPTRESIDVMSSTTGGWCSSDRPETPRQYLSGTGGRHVKLGTGDPAGEGPVPHIPRQDARSPATGLLGRTQPHLREVEERQQCPLPGVCAADMG